jgi:glycosyltransferase involved in cell wall biosynthesis
VTVVAIDYTPAVRQQAGIGRIIRGQVQALLADRCGYDVRLFVTDRARPGDRVARRSGPDAAAPLALHHSPIGERNLARIWHRLDLPWPPVEWFTGGPVDLLHATDFVLPPSRARRKLLTVHDLAFLFYPEAAMPSLHHYLNVVVPRSVGRADHIIADSHHTAHDLQSVWKVPADRLTVVQGAVDHTHFRPVTDDAKIAGVRSRYAIGNGPYILTVSRLEPRKNHVRLIEAFAQARAEARIPHRLVIGGAKGWLYDAIFARVQELQLEEAVDFPGFIAESDLPALYSGADFLAYPSLYEGFGLPIVESLACGTPVLAADNSCLPEAGGPGALYVQAERVDSIAAAIVQLAGNTALRSRLREAGLAHATGFTWEQAAIQLKSAYAAALA